MFVGCVQVLAQLGELAQRQEIHFELGKERALSWRLVRDPHLCVKKYCTAPLG
jgi:hypothetical protein